MKLNFSNDLYKNLLEEANRKDMPLASLITQVLYEYTQKSHSKENQCQEYHKK